METPDFEHVLVNSAAVLKKYPFRLLTQAEYGNNTMRVMRTLLVVALMATAGWMPAFAAERVDFLLVLAADSSRSVDGVIDRIVEAPRAFADSPPGGLANYYRRNVIGGPGAFVVVAENFNSFHCPLKSHKRNGHAVLLRCMSPVVGTTLQAPTHRSCGR